MVRRKVTYQTLRRCADGLADWRKAVLADIPPSIARTDWLVGRTVIALENAQVLGFKRSVSHLALFDLDDCV